MCTLPSTFSVKTDRRCPVRPTNKKAAMKKYQIFLLVIASLTHSSCGGKLQPDSPSQLLGTIATDGGDLVTCESSIENPFKGEMVLDYLLTYDGAGHPKLQTADEYLDRISKELAAKFPALGTSFNEFRRALFSSDERGNRIWKPSNGLELQNISDEMLRDLSFKFPPNCLGSDGKLKLRQLVRREVYLTDDASPRKVYYFYDDMHLNRLKTSNPLQFSYIIVHEWLWDFVNSSWVNRNINHVFQSDMLSLMTANQLKSHMKSIGVPGVMDNSIDFQSPEERQLAKTFSEDENCSFSDRQIFDFSPLVFDIKLRAGETQTLKIDVKHESLNRRGCGLAVLFSHKSEQTPSAKINIKVGRGSMVLPFGEDKWLSVSSNKNLQQSAFKSICGDRDCASRLGDFPEFLTRTNISGFQWSLILTADQDVTIQNPVIMFIPLSK